MLHSNMQTFAPLIVILKKRTNKKHLSGVNRPPSTAFFEEANCRCQLAFVDIFYHLDRLDPYQAITTLFYIPWIATT